MILGMTFETFTFLHVVASLVGIMTGIVVVALMLQSAPIAGWNAFFLASTILTSVTGFVFPIRTIAPAHVLGALSLVALAAAMVAVYRKKLAGPWRPAYVLCSLLALYFNVFVLVVQSFAKFAYLNRFAPNGSEPAFVATQAVVVILFIIAGIAAVRRFRPASNL
jgi:hypothetical protein